jgi:hypothetical protein
MKDIVITIETAELTAKEIVLLIELLSNKIDINTISEMARQENKTPRGIRISNQYRKLSIGKQLLCVKGVTDSNLPF